MKKVLLCLALMTLSGCSAVKYQKEAKKLPDSELGILKQSKENSAWTPFVSSYVKVDKYGKRKGKWEDVYNFWTGYPDVFKMKPGLYLVMYMCDAGSTYAFPVTPAKIEAGNEYYARCFKAKDNKVGVELKK